MTRVSNVHERDSAFVWYVEAHTDTHVREISEDCIERTLIIELATGDVIKLKGDASLEKFKVLLKLKGLWNG